MNSRILYVGVENGAREIPSRLALACRLADIGWTTVIGHKNQIDAVIQDSPPGVYFYKNTHVMAKTRFARAKDRGNLTIATEEEILNFSSDQILDDVQSTAQLHPDVLGFVDYYMSSNKADSILARKILPDSKVLEIGNLRAAYSTFFCELPEVEGASSAGLLINGRLGVTTGPALWETIIFVANVKGLNSAIVEVSAAVEEELSCLSELIPFIAEARKKYAVTFRRHPAEKSDFYRSLFKSTIFYDEGTGPFQHRLSTCHVVAGYSCTTLVEAAIAGCNVVNLGPVQKRFISDCSISKVQPKEFLYENVFSIVDRDFIDHELFHPNLIMDRWVDFFASLGFEQRHYRPEVPMIRLDSYSQTRYGGYGKHELEVDLNLFGLQVNSRRPSISFSAGALVISPHDD